LGRQRKILARPRLSCRRSQFVLERVADLFRTGSSIIRVPVPLYLRVRELRKKRINHRGSPSRSRGRMQGTPDEPPNTAVPGGRRLSARKFSGKVGDAAAKPRSFPSPIIIRSDLCDDRHSFGRSFSSSKAWRADRRPSSGPWIRRVPGSSAGCRS